MQISEEIIKFFSCHDNEETFASLHEQIIKKLTPAGSQVDNKGKQGPSKCSHNVTIKEWNHFNLLNLCN
jgi:hypothetical protein